MSMHTKKQPLTIEQAEEILYQIAAVNLIGGYEIKEHGDSLLVLVDEDGDIRAWASEVDGSWYVDANGHHMLPIGEIRSW